MSMRPLVCGECGYDKFIPVVTGELSGVTWQMSVAGLARAWGSCDLGGGMPLWACGACLHAVGDDEFCRGDGTSPQVQEYMRCVNDLYRNFVPLSDEELNALRGRNLLIGTIRGRLTGDVASVRLPKTANGFNIQLLDDAGNVLLTDTKDELRAEWYRIMCQYVDEHSGHVHLTVRLHRHDRTFAIKHLRDSGNDCLIIGPHATV